LFDRFGGEATARRVFAPLATIKRGGLVFRQIFYSAVSNLKTPGSNRRHCEGRRPVAIQTAAWIATARRASQ
ncbi:MAG: hypothetical protein LBQ62_02625, partial [Candidatus Accumulibacter sp.]|nr:hypothetical protein [Accumulibacter sp.]